MALLEVVVIFGSAVCAVTAGIFYLGRAPIHSTVHAMDPETEGLSFLFDGVDLEHASQHAEAALKREQGATDWQALKAGLSSRFPGLPDADDIQSVETLTLQAARKDDGAVLRLHREAGMTRVEIEDQADDDPNTKHTIQSLEAELEKLRLAATAAPYPIWLADDTGSIMWRNAAYEALERAAKRSDAGAHSTSAIFQFNPDDLSGKSSVRVPVQIDGNGTPEWYSVTTTQAGNATAYHAVDINAVIQAEVAQRNFVQTLAKTFAQLSIGLAIFDRNCQLALFNPALVDLTSLPAEFLSGRPDMLSFFDRLRDNRVMPEPKNYGSWRQEISEMINAASHGSYHETWTLDTGHTYRVTGRPHPDGAIAFLIEDITAEISLTRNFRAELELGQSLMDTLEDALVVFSSAGVLTFCNAAYRDMWKLDPDSSFADVTIVDCLQAWQERCNPDPAWGDMRDFVMKLGERAPWEAEVQHKDAGAIRAQISPIVSGATVIRFSELVNQPAATDTVSS
ncbi:diguanylate cyclase [Tateyamaria omphalii]|uniref:PAS-domain containing protein n=1 Tax=Tateyamaria omphalii TaxID=299262 RepID=UPI0016748A54|nr:PAS-domain containing protein [Tateyamaria omphalii]GGX39696.1 diguanylate cyclase [Tateyamaria omphalii]